MTPKLAVLKQPSLEPDFCSKQLAILADRQRMSVLEVLLRGPATVSELIERTGIEQTLLSYHLRKLREGKFLLAKRSGRTIRYSLSERISLDPATCTLHLGCCSVVFSGRYGASIRDTSR